MPFWTSVPIISRLIARFNLQAYVIDPAEAMLLGEFIQPVTMVDELLKTVKMDTSTQDISGAGVVVYWTVPAKKRWRLKGLTFDTTTGNTKPVIGDGTNNFSLRASGTGPDFFFELDMPLTAGWTIHASGTSNGADTARAMRIIYIEEDAF